VAGLLGARLANIATNWATTPVTRAVDRRMAGGLASFGASPWPYRRLYFSVDGGREFTGGFTDALVPALIAGWALGRVLGPSLW